MAVIEGGASAALADVGSNTKAIRVQSRPIDIGVLGAYQGAFSSGTMAAGLAANSTIFSCRWGDATRAMLVRRISLLAQNAGTAFAAGTFLFELFAARSFTVSDSAGAPILPFAVTNTAKKRTSFGTTLITDLRQSATAAITAGTRTLDSHPLSVIRGAVQATATNYLFVPASGHPMTAAAVAATGTYGARALDLWYPEIDNSWPLVLVQDEGFIIRATVPGTGTWLFTVEIEWAEIATTGGYN